MLSNIDCIRSVWIGRQKNGNYSSSRRIVASQNLYRDEKTIFLADT